jgi:hypothetical protein
MLEQYRFSAQITKELFPAVVFQPAEWLLSWLSQARFQNIFDSLRIYSLTGRLKRPPRVNSPQ